MHVKHSHNFSHIKYQVITSIILIILTSHAIAAKKTNPAFDAFFEHCEKGHADDVKRAIENMDGSFTVNTQKSISDEQFSVSPLYIAASNGYNSVVDILLDNWATLNLLSNFGETPLHGAAKNGRLETVKHLIEKGVSKSHTDMLGWQAIHYAAIFGHTAIVEHLISAGISANVQTKREADDISKIEQAEKGSTLATLAKRYPGGCTPLHAACIGGRHETVQSLVASGTVSNYISQSDSNGWTPLHHACHNRHLKVVEVLVSNGADVHAVVQGKRSPLLMAIVKGSVDIVAHLTQKVAGLVDVRIGDNEVHGLTGEKPIDYVARYAPNNKKNMIQAMINAGADPDDVQASSYRFATERDQIKELLDNARQTTRRGVVAGKRPHTEGRLTEQSYVDPASFTAPPKATKKQKLEENGAAVNDNDNEPLQTNVTSAVSQPPPVDRSSKPASHH